jgi:hypothetical protein
MRHLAFVFAALTAMTAASAQTLTLAQAPNNNGNVGGGIYFNLTVNQTLTINSIDYFCLNAGAGPFQSSFDMFVGPSTWVGQVSANPGPWVQVASSTPVTLPGAGVQTLLNGVLNPAGANPGTVTFAPGNYGIALRAVNHSWRYQGAGAAAVYITSSNADLTCVAGGASNAFLTAPSFAPRAITGAINYTLGGTPMPFAQRESYGAGCYLRTRSFYELWPSSTTVDLANTSMYLTFDPSTNRYAAITGGTTPIAAVTSPDLLLANDANTVITLTNSQPILYPGVGGPAATGTTVEMCSNGYVNLQGTNPAGTFNPTVNGFLTGTPRIGYWHDFDPSGISFTPPATGMSTHYDYDVATSAHLFTWKDCPDSFRGTLGAPTPVNNFQMAFFPNGDVEFRFGTLVLGGGQWPTLVGFSLGGNAVDPGSRDLTASFPFSTDGFDQAALKLVGSTNPILGQTVTLTTSGETAPGLGLTFVTLSDLPGLSPVGFDLGVIGAPGCVANVDINQGAGYVISNTLPGFTMDVPFAIPAGPLSILGASFYSQSLWLDPAQNAFGGVTSNAVRLKIGAF